MATDTTPANGRHSAMAYIRSHYGVPAKRGGRVKYKGRFATIVAARDSFLKLRFDGDSKPSVVK